jgi:two-component system nitrate/nitrite response regulator NarL
MDQDIGYRTQSLPSTLNAPASVTTYLICQNTLLQTGVSYILEGTRFVVAASGLADGNGPELVLLCDSLSQGAAVETIKQLKEQYPDARLVALSDIVDPWTVRELCTAGLDGLCPTGMSKAAMLTALELVMLGEMFLPVSVILAMLEQASAPGTPMMAAANDPTGLPTKFSDREAQILRLLTTGASNKLIARDLGVAEATVKVHIKAILRKAKAANRTQAAMWASQFLAPAAKSPEVEFAS